MGDMTTLLCLVCRVSATSTCRSLHGLANRSMVLWAELKDITLASPKAAASFATWLRPKARLVLSLSIENPECLGAEDLLFVLGSLAGGSLQSFTMGEPPC